MATEKRLIDANESPCNECDIEVCYRLCMEFREWFDNATTVDAVEVVRCKDCKFYRKPFCLIHDNKHGWLNHELPEHFCSHGERKSDV